MKKETYYNKLLALQSWLNQNPDKKLCYSDLRVNQEVNKLKYEIMEEQYNEENRLHDYEFYPTSHNPFI